jgi:hypothetical protein
LERRTLGDGRYELLDQIGRGGMATVWRALDTRLGVERAVKILQPQAPRTTRTARDRFDREARLMARLEHPHIVPVHDVGIDGDRIFMVMSLLRGGALSDLLERHGPMSPRRACAVTEGVLRALATAHAHGVIHRDVKPQNVLIDDLGTPRLADFGIARVVQEDGALTRTGAVMGTYAFMAPEQRSNAREADPRSDIYAVGAQLMALLTAQVPYDLHHPDALAMQVAGLPDPLRAFVARCTRFVPGERYATALDALAALQAAVSELPPEPDEAQPLQPLPRLNEPQSTLYTVPPTVPSEEPPVPPAPAASASRWWLAGALGGGVLLLGALGALGAVLVGLTLAGLATWGPDGTELAGPAELSGPAPEPPPAPAPAPVEVPAPVAPPAPAPAPRAAPARPVLPVPAPAPVLQPEPAPAPTLSVRVAALPSATLEVNGKAVGPTPWSGPLPYGTHMLGFRKADGTLALRRPITVVEGGKLEYCWVLETEEPCSR